jgi:glycosyltransferase involved in cell wall biosynthesis
VRIVVDIRYRTRSGAVSYLYNMAPRLVQAGSRHDFVLLRNTGQPLPGGVEAESLELPPQRGPVQALHDQLLLPRLLRSAGADIYHPLKYLGSMRPGCAQVTTVHAITEDYRGTFPGTRSEAVYWKVMGRRIMRASSALIAVSGFIRDFLVDRIGAEPGRITVVPNGIDPRFSPLPHTLPATPPYLLAVGNIFPVKNHVTAVRAFAEVAAAYPSLRLKLAGATHHPYCQEVRAAAAAAGVLERVDFLGYVEAADLVPLMNGAELLLMPSLTEGCPVTLLEAMACGVVVIASGRGGIPETAGGAAVILDDPHDVMTWGAELRSLLGDEARRARCRDAALERAAAFTWERTVADTLAVYDSLESPGSR